MCYETVLPLVRGTVPSDPLLERCVFRSVGVGGWVSVSVSVCVCACVRVF